jgi:hypothetical protein
VTTIILYKIKVAHVFNNFQPFIQPLRSIIESLHLIIGPYPDPGIAIKYINAYLFKYTI